MLYVYTVKREADHETLGYLALLVLSCLRLPRKRRMRTREFIRKTAAHVRRKNWNCFALDESRESDWDTDLIYNTHDIESRSPKSKKPNFRLVSAVPFPFFPFPALPAVSAFTGQ